MLNYLILPIELRKEQMQTKLVDTLADSQLSITVSAAGVTLRDGSASTAQLTRTDMLATNGVVHHAASIACTISPFLDTVIF